MRIAVCLYERCSTFVSRGLPLSTMRMETAPEARSAISQHWTLERLSIPPTSLREDLHEGQLNAWLREREATLDLLG